jgi:gamma-glutamylcysteine synthetase
VNFILKDPTRIFVGATPWQQLRKRGFSVEVLENIEIAALAVNPFSPAGYSFDHKELLTAMRDAAGDIPVFDVKYDGR